MPARESRTLTIMALASLIAGGCATASLAKQGGSAGTISWRVEEAAVQEELGSGRTKWRYVLVLHNTTATELHLTQMKREAKGSNVAPSTTDWPIDFRLRAGEDVSLLCFEAVTTRSAATAQWYDLTVTKTYSGRDSAGKTIESRIEVALDRFMPRREPIILDFARFTEQAAATATLLCETVPPAMTVFDPDRHEAVHFLIAVDNVQRRVPVRTRWISPSGEEMKVIIGDIRTENVARTSTFVHVTHTVTTSVMRARPGRWKVELFLDDKPQGAFTFEIAPAR